MKHDDSETATPFSHLVPETQVQFVDAGTLPFICSSSFSREIWKEPRLLLCTWVFRYSIKCGKWRSREDGWIGTKVEAKRG